MSWDANEQKFLLLFSKRSVFFCSFLKKRTKKLLFIGLVYGSGLFASGAVMANGSSGELIVERRPF
jgi:hypothetical protein